MRTPLFFLVLFAGSLLISGCDLLGEEDTRSDLEFRPGLRLTYSWSFTSESPVGAQPSVSDTFHVFVHAEDRRIGGYDDLLRLDATSATRSSVKTSTWYHLSDSALIAVAYRNSGSTPIIYPKQESEHSSIQSHSWLLPGLPLHASTASDSIIVRRPPRLVFQLPLQVGDTWTSFETPFRSTRRVTEQTDIRTPAGTFMTYRIQTSLSINPSYYISDYVRNNVPVFHQDVNIYEVRDSLNNPAGTATDTSRSVLIAVE